MTQSFPKKFPVVQQKKEELSPKSNARLVNEQGSSPSTQFFFKLSKLSLTQVEA
ncbi:hypothetical protein [Laspinema olomoucense]|uniref:Uncharacterized protein n=1 Tax=Laspinema olomoucense D3b TaxID=2953688 RepID=A0ABT2NAR0_9CYAN|nr:hypothetical protein [Laspinema sp. D3b]MCT7979792.1 hypothetical protein [Laspinema sp. D3b]